MSMLVMVNIITECHSFSFECDRDVLLPIYLNCTCNKMQGHDGKFSVYVHASKEKPVHVSPYFVGREIHSEPVWGIAHNLNIYKLFIDSFKFQHKLMMIKNVVNTTIWSMILIKHLQLIETWGHYPINLSLFSILFFYLL